MTQNILKLSNQTMRQSTNLVCKQILENKFRHDFQQCSCKNKTFTDGGNNYGSD